MQIKFISSSSRPPGLVRKALALVATVALAAVALMFSAVLLVLVLILLLFGGAYLWWKTRELRKQMRDFPPPGANVEGEVFRGEVYEGEVIEGEAIRVEDSADKSKR